MEMRELIHEETRDGFVVRFYTMPEHDAPEDHIATGSDVADKEWLDKIRSGELQWFTACVTASKNGLELGASYLGACDWADPADFVKDSWYFDDMAEEAIAEARERIAALCREAV